MKIRTRRALVATAALAVGFGGLTSAANAVPTDHQIGPADLFTTHSETNGSYDFLKEGVHLQTKDQTAYAKGYFNVTKVDLKDVHDVSFEWFGSGYGTANGNNNSTDGGSTGSPGIYYNVDVDGDNRPDGQLIGEAAYGGQDVWLNRDVEDGGFGGVQTQPSGYFAKSAPSCTEGTNCTGGSGSEFHGTLDAWAAKILSRNGDTARVVSSGFLANGLIENGVLRSVTLGNDRYVFSNDAGPGAPADVTGDATHEVEGRMVTVTMTTDPLPAGASQGADAVFEVTQGPQDNSRPATVRFHAPLGADKVATWSMTFPAGTPSRRIKVTLNGAVVDSFIARG